MIANAVAAEITYHDIKKLLHKTVFQFQEKYGGPLDELVSVCNEAFVESYCSYNNEIASFVTWFRIKAWYAMMDYRRLEIRRRKKIPQCPFEFFELLAPQKQPMWWEEVRPMLSADARCVFDSIVNAPQEILGSDRCKRPSEVRDAIWEAFLGLGWSAKRVRLTFDEICKAVKQ